MSNSRIKKSEGGTGQKLRDRLTGNKNAGLTAPKTKLYLALCFAVPFLLMTFAFAFNKVFPFGDQQILVTDFWQQYFPFYTEVQDKLQTGQSLLYSWDTGMGTNFWGIAAYYYASPFNLLLTFVPDPVPSLPHGLCGTVLRRVLKGSFQTQRSFACVFRNDVCAVRLYARLLLERHVVRYVRAVPSCGVRNVQPRQARKS